tara:strand:- start:211 stop:1023 length:813 start_codon:yes stop_codon:yes gene_type:complete
MSNLKEISFESWWRVRFKTNLKFASAKNNLMNPFTSKFEKVMLSGRYDHFLSKSKSIKIWDSILANVRNPIDNETTLSLIFQYSRVYLPFLYTMKKLELLAIQNPANSEELTEIDFANLTNLKKLRITGTTTNVIPLESIKNLDKLTLKEITIKNCKSANLINLDTTKLKKLVIHRIKDVVKLPNIENTTIDRLELKNLTLESISPIINMGVRTGARGFWVYFENVVLLNGLTKEEEIKLLNNNNMDNWTKKRIMKLLSNIPNKKSIRTR